MKHTYFKLNEDDILSIVKDYLLKQTDLGQSQGNLGLVQSSKGDIHLVAAFADIRDHTVQQLDLRAIGNEINFNGPISSLSDSAHMNLNSSEAKERLQKLFEKLKTKEFE